MILAGPAKTVLRDIVRGHRRHEGWWSESAQAAYQVGTSGFGLTRYYAVARFDVSENVIDTGQVLGARVAAVYMCFALHPAVFRFVRGVQAVAGPDGQAMRLVHDDLPRYAPLAAGKLVRSLLYATTDDVRALASEMDDAEPVDLAD